MLRKDVKNELRSVNDLAFSDVRQVVQLGGGQLAVKDKHVGMALQGRHLELCHLAPAENESGIDAACPVDHAAGYGQACRAGQALQFIQIAFLQYAGLCRDRNQQGAGLAAGGLRRMARTRQLLFQRFGVRRKTGFGLIPWFQVVQPIGGAPLVMGQQPCGLPLDRLADRIDGERDDGVQPEKEHVHEIFLTQAVRREVCVQKVKPAQASLPRAAALKVGNVDAVRLADEHHSHPAFPVDEKADLPSDRTREQGEFASLFQRVNGIRRETAIEKTSQGIDLALLEPLHVTFRSGDGRLPAMAASMR